MASTLSIPGLPQDILDEINVYADLVLAEMDAARPPELDDLPVCTHGEPDLLGECLRLLDHQPPPPPPVEFPTTAAELVAKWSSVFLRPAPKLQYGQKAPPGLPLTMIGRAAWHPSRVSPRAAFVADVRRVAGVLDGEPPTIKTNRLAAAHPEAAPFVAWFKWINRMENNLLSSRRRDPSRRKRERARKTAGHGRQRRR